MRIRVSTPATLSVPPSARPRDYSRRRAWLLASVYLLFGLHIAHWKLAGRTLAPLELNEVLYTAELGIVTAGFLFMVLAFVGTLVFGRFFCSWGCHILALEDLCGWILRKLHIQPKPVRSRVLRLVPFLALGEMFVVPQIVRIAEGRPFPKLHVLVEGQGWASFLTNDFWRNLPSPGVALATFAVCGFAIVYVLGSRAFCTYGCPYGALFNLLDRFAPGRLALVKDCKDCGRCTAVCTSHVRVHEEVQKHGQVVNAECLKDLDCVAACPENALAFAFRKPPGLASFGSRRATRLAWDYTLVEDLAMLAIAIATLVVLRGLYETLPYLMSLALSGMAAFAFVHALRLLSRADLRLAPFQLRRAGHVLFAGWIFLALVAGGVLFGLHSAWIRWEESRGLAALASVEHAGHAGDAAPAPELAAARAHLDRRARYGLATSATVERARGRAAELAGDLARAEELLAAEYDRGGGELDTALQLAHVLARGGRAVEARHMLQSILDVPLFSGHTLGRTQEIRVEAALALGEMQAEAGELEAAEANLRGALELRPQRTDVLYALGVVLHARGQTAAARELFQRAVDGGARDADLSNNLGRLFYEAGEFPRARAELERALEIDERNAAAHYNLGLVLERQGNAGAASAQFARARELDARYAQPRR